MQNRLARGTQVVYTPEHLKGSNEQGVYSNNGIQAGFVTSDAGINGVFVRYWMAREGRIIHYLLTLGNSQLTPRNCLVVQDSVPQEWVTEALERFC